MYYPNQVVWSLDKQKPVQIGDDVWDTKAYPGKTTNFIDASGKAVCPKSIKEAKLLMRRRKIAPALIGEDYCWSCTGELYQEPRKDCAAKDDHIKCECCGGARYASYGKKLGKMRCEECYRELEKNGMLAIANQLVKELELSKSRFDAHGSKASVLIEQLVMLDDPSYIKRDGRFRDELDKMVRNRPRPKQGEWL